MNKDRRGLFQKRTKTCFVVLQRLDENLLNEYSKKYGLKTTSTLRFFKNTEHQPVHCNDYQKLPKRVNISRKRKIKDVEDSVKKNEFNRKKSEVNGSCYSDDDDCSRFKSSDETLLVERKALNERKSCVSFDSSVFVNKVPRSRKKNESNASEICKDCKSTKMGLHRQEENGTVPEIGEEKNESILENNFNCSHCRENCKVPVSTIKSESASRHGKKKCDKEIHRVNSSERDRNKAVSLFKNECLPEEIEDMEYDSREDSEDDKTTVIFEEELHEDENHKLNGQEIKRARVNKRRDLKTRKKQMLIKFRKKTLRRIKKPKPDFVEKCSSEKAVKKTLFEVSEDCLEEVCGSVKRLHELYQIISQLQKELPKNDELAVHFSKVISAQQENFHKEIRKSQKMILQCYEKMLISCSDPNKVTLEISKRTSLSADDVINVISCCLLLEGACEVEKSEKLEVFQSQKAAINSDSKLQVLNGNSVKPIARVTIQETDRVEPLHPCLPSWTADHHAESFQRSNSEYAMACQPAAKVQNHGFNGLPSGHCSESRAEYERNKSYTRQSCIEKNQMAGDPKTVYIAHEQMNLHFAKRHLLQIRSSKPSYTGVQSSPILQSFKPIYYGYPVSSFDLRHQGSLSSTGEGGANIPLSGRSNPYLLNYIQERSTVNQLCQQNLGTLNVSFTIPMPAVENTVECVNVSNYSASPYCNNLPVRTFPPKSFNKLVISRNQILTSDENQFQLEVGSVKSSEQISLFDKKRLSIDETTGRNFCIEAKSTTGLGNRSSDSLQNGLDPTVPQKLTMKNHRLQAGPVLDVDTDGEMSDRTAKLNLPINEENNLKKLENLNLVDSKSRAYVCAQNGCKNPGVRICRGCQSIIYCSDTCQLKHWTQKHKAECYQLKKLRE